MAKQASLIFALDIELSIEVVEIPEFKASGSLKLAEDRKLVFNITYGDLEI